eukprot:Blabericola_migrator_1__5431@NODE_2778_length_2365_cov_9_591384_g1740_i0_p1_GENE_NODE_2778_length_2365_cov_9_591384_g1740_i0NODE_2778_length_2365_cov_9_591384_g1740_i0_p1_ORF_typecomplete_len422_score62_76Branch/PF02485_21/0_009_NODE_2778_length_2365_cov_9_591384_g1740_i02151480
MLGPLANTLFFQSLPQLRFAPPGPPVLLDEALTFNPMYAIPEDVLSLDPMDVIDRFKAERENRSAFSVPLPVGPNDPHGFALTFMTVRQIDSRLVWERWLRDAYDWIHSEGLEPEYVLPEDSSVLRTYVHFAGAFDRDKIKELMTPMMKESPIDNPETCPWKKLGACFKRAVQVPYQTWPEAGYMMLLSHNSIPLKPFSAMYREFLKDRRARVSMSWWCFGKDTLAPKTATWKAMPREIVRPILERPYWTEMGWMLSPFGTGGPEEGQLWLPVMAEYGESFPEFFHPGIMAGQEGPWGSRVRWHMDCWPGTSMNPKCFPLGNDAHGGPREFKSVKADGLEALLRDPFIWSLRKITDDTMVNTTDGQIPIADYLSSYWNSPYVNFSVPIHPALSQTLTWSRGTASVADNIAQWKKQGIYGLK